MRFDADGHVYTEGGTEVPSITQLLKLGGLVDDTWFTEESSRRGTLVHTLTAAHDLGALEVHEVPEAVKGYVLAYIKAGEILMPEWDAIEEPATAQLPGTKVWFAGRPDRVGKIDGRKALLEIKTTVAPHSAHPVQTALQALLVGEVDTRYALYLTPAGRFRLVEHTDPGDFLKAKQLVLRYGVICA